MSTMRADPLPDAGKLGGRPGSSGFRLNEPTSTPTSATQHGDHSQWPTQAVTYRSRFCSQVERTGCRAYVCLRALEPLVEHATFHGLRVGPNSSGSHDGLMPNSGVFACRAPPAR